MGLATVWAVLRIPTRRAASLSFVLYAAGLLSLAAVLVAGVRINGATRWFRLGPLSLQPSEFAKLFAMLYLARFLSWPDRSGTWKGFVSAWILAGLPIVLIQLQPDLTTAMLLAPSAFAMLWISGVSLRRWATFGACAAGLFAILWFSGAIHDYQKSRVTTFLKKYGIGSVSAADHRRMAEREAYQEIQARIAIGSGGILGKGYLSGTQNQLAVIPMSSSDFIYAVVAEEWGFVGSLVLLGLYAALVLELFQAARRSGDPFGQLFAAGFAAHLACQVVINLAMATGIFPVVGIPLPLVSAGGSSIVATLAGLAVCARIASSEE